MLSAENRDVLALCVLAVLGMAAFGWIISILRRSPLTPIQSALFALNYVIARVLWRTRVTNPFPIPPGQGAVILCNHRCPLDPSFIAMSVPRVVHWMVAREYCEQPGLQWVLRTCQVIPTNRGGVDTAATRSAIRWAAEGELVGLFPEARINTTQELLLPGRLGAAMIAIKARVPVVPCFIRGAPYDGTTLGCFLMPARVHLTFGKPLDISAYFGREKERETLEELTRLFLREIARLGDQPDYKPRVAGRS